MTHEILTPTEKLKALRQTAKLLSDALGKVVTYDDETTEAIMAEAESYAVSILQTIHDSDPEDMSHAVLSHPTDAEVLRFEHSIDYLLERKEQLNEAYHALINHPRAGSCADVSTTCAQLPISDAGYEILQNEANSLNRQIMDIDDTINNLYAVREVCPSD